MQVYTVVDIGVKCVSLKLNQLNKGTRVDTLLRGIRQRRRRRRKSSVNARNE
jgi:hypothetical protein